MMNVSKEEDSNRGRGCFQKAAEQIITMKIHLVALPVWSFLQRPTERSCQS